ncbi:protein kinase domain-containing protein [Parafilimonas sp.]|uniref:protein kinase domain-containing protein n=1 Tax=Parafilimonas sp. TaxID=1969739 RepID=UPI003F7CF4DA
MSALQIGVALQPNLKYKITDVLGMGGFGTTYLAWFDSLKRNVAIKEYYPSRWCYRNGNIVHPISQHSQLYERFKNSFLEEAKQLAQFTNDNIIRITDVFAENNTAYFVMEYVEGQTLQQLVRSKGNLSQRESIKIIKQIGGALEIINEKAILHRDVKPANIIINKEGKAILIDFGAAREIVDTDVEQTAIFSEGYAAPEQYSRTGKKGSHIDVYGLGATLYYSLTGQIPTSARLRIMSTLLPPNELNNGISKDLSDTVMKSMEMEVENRFPNISKFLYQLSTLRIIEPVGEQTKFTQLQEEAFKNIREFLVNKEDKIFVLTGVANSGKSLLISRINDEVKRLLKHSVLITIGSRLAEKQTFELGLSFRSIYSYIYDLNDTEIQNIENGTIDENIIDEFSETEDYLPHYPLKANEDALETVYTLDDAQLLADLNVDDELAVFGSGKMLTDFINFTQVQLSNGRKVIFIGDDKEIIRGEETLSLSQSLLEKKFQVAVKYFNLSKPVYKGIPKIFADNALTLTEAISKNLFNNLWLTKDSINVYMPSASEIEGFYSTYASMRDKIFITYSHKQVFNANVQIRKSVNKGIVIEKGDRMLMSNTIYVMLNGVGHNIYSGEFGEVLSCSPDLESIRQKVKKIDVLLLFRRVQIHFPRLGISPNLLILDSYLNSDSKEISKEERIAMMLVAKRKYKEANPDKKLYKANTKFLLKDNEYFNVALIKYGYAITNHKAQGWKWNEVMLDCETDQGKENETYFRWLYTGLKASKEKLYLLNVPKITPYIHLACVEAVNAFDEYMSSSFLKVNIPSYIVTPEVEEKARLYNFPLDKPALIRLFAYNLSQFELESVKFLNVEHKQYQELYSISDAKNNLIKLQFSYDNSGKISIPQPLPNNEATKELVTKLYFRNIDFSLIVDESFIKTFIVLLKEKLRQKNINLWNVATHNYNLELTLKRTTELLVANVFYTKEGFFYHNKIDKV